MRFKIKKSLISAAGLAVLTALFILWAKSGSHSTAGLLAAFFSAALFAAVCLRFVPAWINAWSGQMKVPLNKPDYVDLRIFTALIMWDIILIMLVYILRFAFFAELSFKASLEFWTYTDSHHYLDIARDWYLSEGSIDRLVQLVFLPGYPIAVRLVNFLVGDYLYSGFLVSGICFAASGCVLYKLVRLDMPAKKAQSAVRFLAVSPAVFFLVSPMSESLFLLLALLSLYFMRKERFFVAAAFGALAAFTRSLGITLLVPLLFELVQSRARVKSYLALLVLPLGFAAYLLINYEVSGDFLKFMEYQSGHWGQRLGFFWNTACYQTEQAIECLKTGDKTVLGLWLPNLIISFGVLAIMLHGAGELRASYTAWFIAYYVISIGATWLLSAPRYMLVSVPVYLSLADMTETPSKEALIMSVGLITGAFYILAFCLRLQVW